MTTAASTKAIAAAKTTRKAILSLISPSSPSRMLAADLLKNYHTGGVPLFHFPKGFVQRLEQPLDIDAVPFRRRLDRRPAAAAGVHLVIVEHLDRLRVLLDDVVDDHVAGDGFHYRFLPGCVSARLYGLGAMTASRTVFSTALRPCGSFGSVTTKAPAWAACSPFPVIKAPFPCTMWSTTREGAVWGGISYPGRSPKTTTRIASESYRSLDTGLSGEKSASFRASNMGYPLPFLSGRRHRIVSQRLTTPRTMPKNCATLPAQSRIAAAGTMKPMAIPAVADTAIQKCAEAHAPLRSGLPAERGGVGGGAEEGGGPPGPGGTPRSRGVRSPTPRCAAAFPRRAGGCDTRSRR